MFRPEALFHKQWNTRQRRNSPRAAGAGHRMGLATLLGIPGPRRVLSLE
jgi:hypothetical protein